jgi:hypothetical protein
MIEMSKIGYGRSKHELLDTVQKIIQSDGRRTPFNNGRSGKDWYDGFMRRHPALSGLLVSLVRKER